MMSMKVFGQLIFGYSAILADIIISITHFLALKLPASSSVVGNTPLPIRMFLASIFLATKYVIALSRTEAMSLFAMALPSSQAHKLTTSFTSHYRDCRVIVMNIAKCMGLCSSKMNGIASYRTPFSNVCLSTINNELFVANLAYQPSHSYIIPPYASVNQASDYRPRRNK